MHATTADTDHLTERCVICLLRFLLLLLLAVLLLLQQAPALLVLFPH
jgi:hypothetical protein